ncbi:MAG: VanZ family protein [Variibacter sp.]
MSEHYAYHVGGAAQPPAASAFVQKNVFRLLAWGALGAVFIATMVPIGLRPISGLPINAERFLAFAALGALFAAGYPRRFWLVSALVLVAAGGFELAQHVTLTRHGTVHDFLVKGIGGGLGLAITHVVMLCRAARHQRRPK